MCTRRSLDFLKFPKENNLSCSGIDHGLQYKKSANVYHVDYTYDNSYPMQFDRKQKQYKLNK